MSLRTSLLIGLAAFLGFLVWHLPATHLYAGSLPKEGTAALQLHGLSGALGEGRASGLSLRQQPVLGGLHWQLRPLSLLLGRLSADVEAADPILTAGVSVGLGGLRVRDLRLNGNLRPLLAAAGQPFLPLDGQVGLDFGALRIRGGWPTAAEGRIELRQLHYTLARDPVLLGDYTASVQPEGDDLVLLVQTQGGALEVNGDGRIKPDRHYELHLQLKARPGAPPMVQNLLRSLGDPDAQGYYHLRRQGQAPAEAPPA